MLTFSNEDLVAKIGRPWSRCWGADAGGWDFLPFSDLETSVNEDVETLRRSPLIPSDIPIGGAVYDVKAGTVHEVARK